MTAVIIALVVLSPLALCLPVGPCSDPTKGHQSFDKREGREAILAKPCVEAL